MFLVGSYMKYLLMRIEKKHLKITKYGNFYTFATDK